MSIKTLLEKAMLRLGSRGGMRLDSEGVKYPMSGEKLTFIAPTDGEVTLSGMVASGKSHGYLNVDPGMSQQVTDRWYYLRSIGRVKKGQSVMCEQHDMDDIACIFYSTVGGA